jgi:hypothetical protein
VDREGRQQRAGISDRRGFILHPRKPLDPSRRDSRALGADNLRFPQAQRIASLPEERRNRDNPIQYVVTASREFEQKLADFIQAQGQWMPPA